MRRVSENLEMSARTNFSSLLIFSSDRRSETFNTYLPASSRRRCVPTSPAAPVIRMVFMNGLSYRRRTRLLHRDAPQRARIVWIDQRGGVQQRSVVPNHQITNVVPEPVKVLRLRRVRFQLVEQRDRFIVWHALDAEGAARHRIQRFAARHRMGACDAMPDPAHAVFLFVGQQRRDGTRPLVQIVAV